MEQRRKEEQERADKLPDEIVPGGNAAFDEGLDDEHPEVAEGGRKKLVMIGGGGLLAALITIPIVLVVATGGGDNKDATAAGAGASGQQQAQAPAVVTQATNTPQPTQTPQPTETSQPTAVPATQAPAVAPTQPPPPATPTPQPTQPPANVFAGVGPISATFAQPAQRTDYVVTASAQGYTFEWSGADCGTSGPTSPGAFMWHHPHPPCDASTNHSNRTIRVVVTHTATNQKLVCTYHGAASGTGAACTPE
jgi:hypothetical protein